MSNELSAARQLAMGRKFLETAAQIESKKVPARLQEPSYCLLGNVHRSRTNPGRPRSDAALIARGYDAVHC